jgi:DNA primase
VIANTVRFPAQTIEAVRSAVRVEDVIAERIPLRRSGKILVGPCPWHKSRSGRSFIVYPERQSWRCWNCGVGGDVFDFLERYSGASFPATVKLLAAHSAIELDRDSPQQAAEALSKRTELAQVEARIEEILETEFRRVADELDRQNRLYSRATWYLAELGTGEAERHPGETELCWFALECAVTSIHRLDTEYTLLAFGKQADRERFVISDAQGRNTMIDALLEAE